MTMEDDTKAMTPAERALIDQLDHVVDLLYGMKPGTSTATLREAMRELEAAKQLVIEIGASGGRIQ